MKSKIRKAQWERTCQERQITTELNYDGIDTPPSTAVFTALHLFLSLPDGPMLGVGHNFFCQGPQHAGPGLALHASLSRPPAHSLLGALASRAGVVYIR
jgi:hypothetical protein